jgi:hypothetical protein
MILYVLMGLLFFPDRAELANISGSRHRNPADGLRAACGRVAALRELHHSSILPVRIPATIKSAYVTAIPGVGRPAKGLEIIIVNAGHIISHCHEYLLAMACVSLGILKAVLPQCSKVF